MATRTKPTPKAPTVAPDALPDKPRRRGRALPANHVPESRTFSFRVPVKLVAELDALVEAGTYTNRTEALERAIIQLAQYHDRDVSHIYAPPGTPMA